MFPCRPDHANKPPPAQAFPKQLLLRELPPEMDILCTHPMFGPDSGKGSWQGLNFMYETVRVGHDAQRLARVENFLKVRRELRAARRLVCPRGGGPLPAAAVVCAALTCRPAARWLSPRALA